MVTLRLRFPRFRTGIPLERALHDVRWALAAGLLYLVGVALIGLILGLAELGVTAEGMRHLPERVPYQHEAGR